MARRLPCRSAWWQFLYLRPLPQGQRSSGDGTRCPPAAASSRGENHTAASSSTPTTGNRKIAENLAVSAAPIARPHSASLVSPGRCTYFQTARSEERRGWKEG